MADWGYPTERRDVSPLLGVVERGIAGGPTCPAGRVGRPQFLDYVEDARSRPLSSLASAGRSTRALTR